MAYKMKGFGGFGNSPAKQYSTKIGPAEKPGTTKGKRKAMMEASFSEFEEKSKDFKKSADYEKDKESPTNQIIQEVNPSKQVPLSKHEEEKGTMITGGSKSEIIADLGNRIEFLNSDILEENSIMKKGKMITQRDKLKSRLKAERAK